MISWRPYAFGCAVYFCINAVIMDIMSLPTAEAVTWAISNTLPPSLLGIGAVRFYNARRRWAWPMHVALAALFATASVFSTHLMTRAILGSRPWMFTLEGLVWGWVIAMFLFVIIASTSHLQRVQSDLALERERAAAAEGARAKAELAALRARIDPHFLFNTLHSLLALVRQDPGRAEEAIEQFGDILRYTFAAGDGSEERTLQQEWQLVDNYLALERLRLGARLRVTASLDADVATVPLPVLTLQPLVENAVRHAIAPRAAGGRVDVHAKRHDGRVRITVCDDGPGLTSAPRNGRGLDLVRQRLDRMYGDRATLQLGRSPDGGLCVTIDLL
ncbi:MAG TPA: histidine kinase [Thermoanaerobaculia bacterium]